MPTNLSLGHNFPIHDMRLKPPRHELCLHRIRKIFMIRIDNADEVRILSHAQVVLDVFENHLDDRITVPDVCSGQIATIDLA